MPATTVPSREQTAEARALRARIALGVKMLTNAGYAMIGGGVFKALLETHSLPWTAYLWAGAGLAALAFALWFAPQGTPADD